MASSTFSIFSNAFGFVMGIVSLLALVINMCRTHLPSNRIKELEELMDGTETLFSDFIEDGLLVEPLFVNRTERHLKILRDTTRSLQCRVYSAATLRQDYVEFFRGTSRAIGDACQSLKLLKAEVISSSKKGNVAIDEQNLVICSSTPPFLPSVSNHEHHQAMPSLPLQLSRPRSCPPALERTETNSIALLNGIHPAIPYRVTLDVRTTDGQR